MGDPVPTRSGTPAVALVALGVWALIVLGLLRMAHRWRTRRSASGLLIETDLLVDADVRPSAGHEAPPT